MRFIPEWVWFEKDAFDYPLGRALYNRFRGEGITVQMTASHNRVTGIPGKTPQEAYFEAKRTLVVGVRRILKFAPCKPSVHYQLPLNTSCSGKREYCYLNTTLGKKPYIRVYVNIEEILSAAARYIDDRAPEITVFEGAATSDPIPAEHYTDILKEAIAFFGRQKYGRFRFVTKFTDINSLLDAPHNGHTRFRFSVNAEEIIRQFEHATPPLQERLAAAKKVALAGYPLGFLVTAYHGHGQLAGKLPRPVCRRRGGTGRYGSRPHLRVCHPPLHQKGQVQHPGRVPKHAAGHGRRSQSLQIRAVRLLPSTSAPKNPFGLSYTVRNSSIFFMKIIPFSHMPQAYFTAAGDFTRVSVFHPFRRERISLKKTLN